MCVHFLLFCVHYIPLLMVFNIKETFSGRRKKADVWVGWDKLVFGVRENPRASSLHETL